MMRFISYDCPRCGATLPIEVRYDTKGMVMATCRRCEKCVYIYNLKIVQQENNKRKVK